MGLSPARADMGHLCVLCQRQEKEDSCGSHDAMVLHVETQSFDETIQPTSEANYNRTVDGPIEQLLSSIARGWDPGHLNRKRESLLDSQEGLTSVEESHYEKGGR